MNRNKYFILVVALWFSVQCTSCISGKDLPNNINEENPTGEMGGGTGTGTIGDDPTNP